MPTPIEQVLVDESRRDLRDARAARPIRLYDWCPGSDSASGLVVISHGTGGSGRDMGWLARPLVAAGLRVLSLDHHGNNHVDGYHPEGFLFPWERPRDISFVLDALGCDPQRPRVGVVGFSAGGYTAAALTGARLDAAVLAAILDGRIPLPPIPEMPQALDQLQARHRREELAAAAALAGADLRDSRVAAVFLVAPGLGGMLTPDSLAAVETPVEIRWGDADTINPFDQDVRPLLEHIPSATGLEVGPGVEHDHFIAPLTPERPEVRQQVAVDAAAFFLRHLPAGRGGTSD